MKEAIRDWWQAINVTKPEPQIFWWFDDERNNVIKEYALSVVQGLKIKAGQEPIHSRIQGRSYLIEDGTFAGQDARDVYERAIAWWREQLHEICIDAWVLSRHWQAKDE